MTAAVGHFCKGERGFPRVPCFNDGSRVPSLWDSKSSCDISSSGSLPMTQGRPLNTYCSLGIIIVVLGCAGMEKHSPSFPRRALSPNNSQQHCRDTLLSTFLISSLCFFKEFNICVECCPQGMTCSLLSESQIQLSLPTGKPHEIGPTTISQWRRWKSP